MLKATLWVYKSLIRLMAKGNKAWVQDIKWSTDLGTTCVSALANNISSLKISLPG